MKKVILLLIFISVLVLAGCKPQVECVDCDYGIPSISGVSDATLEWGTSFDPLEGVEATWYVPEEYPWVDTELTLTYEGEVDIYTPGNYYITYTVSYVDGEVSALRTITVLEGVPTLATGLYNLRHADADTKNAFLSASEKYLMERQVGGINLFSSASLNIYSSRMQLHNEEFVAVVGFDEEHSTMSADDSTVDFLHGYEGQVGEYTYRTTISNSLWNFNQYLYDTSTESEVMQHIYSGLYQYVTNEDHTGYQIVPDLAKGMPIPVGTSEDYYGTLRNTTWRIPIKEDLKWYFHPNVSDSFLQKNPDTAITAVDFIDTYKLALDEEWFRAISGGGDFLGASYRIKGVEEYLDGELDWDDVGFKAVTDGEGKEYIEFTFEEYQSEWNVIYHFSNFVLSPINIELYHHLLSEGETYGLTPESTAYHGPYYVEENIDGEYILLHRNPNYHTEASYFIDNYLFSVMYDLTSIFELFEDGYLDYSGIPHLQFQEYADNPNSRKVPGATVYRINLNRLGTVEAQREQFPDGAWIPEPILANDDFVMAMFHAIDRNTLANDILNGTRLPFMYYFSKGHISDVESGIPYRNTEEGISVGEGFSPDSHGYDFSKAKELFIKAIDQLLEDGVYEVGTEDDWTVITLDLNTYTGSESWDLTCAYLKSAFEDAFQDEERFIKVQIDIYPRDFPAIYYDYMMIGEFDMSIGGISSNLICNYNYMDYFCSDNRSGFLLNYGIDTSVPEINVIYTDYDGVIQYETFSYDAITSLLLEETVLYEGREFDGPNPIITETTDTTLTFDVDFIEHPMIRDVTYTVQEWVLGEGYEDVNGYVDIPLTSLVTTVEGLEPYYYGTNEQGNTIYQGDYRVLLEFIYNVDEEVTGEQFSNWEYMIELLTETSSPVISTTSLDVEIEVYGDRTPTMFKLYERPNNNYSWKYTVNLDSFDGFHIQDLSPNTEYLIKLYFDTGEYTYYSFTTRNPE